MSIDGPGILESDLAHDVYNEILDLYDSGVPITQLRTRIAAYEESLEDDLDRELYLAASAKAYWEIGHLPSDFSMRLSRIVEGGRSLALWAQRVDQCLAVARRASLRRLMRQIATPRAKPRPRKKYTTIRKKLYSVGDCVQLDVGGKLHRGVVCKVREYRGKCDYAMLTMEPATISTIESFASSRYYGHVIPSSLDERGYVFGPHLMFLEHRMLLRAGNPFQIIGRIDLDETTYSVGSFGGILDMDGVVEDLIRTEANPNLFGLKLLPLRQLIRRSAKPPAQENVPK